MRLDLQPYLKQLRQMKRTLPMSACFQLEAVEERVVVGRYDGPEARVRGIFDLKSAGGSVAVDLPDGTYTDRITGREVTVSGAPSIWRRPRRSSADLPHRHKSRHCIPAELENLTLTIL